MHKTRVNFLGALKIALAVGLVSAFFSTQIMALHVNPQPQVACSGSSCTGSCNENGGNCCAEVSGKCACVGVNSACSGHE